MKHLRITIAVADVSVQEIVIAWLTQLGCQGFEQLEFGLHAYFPEDHIDAVALDARLVQFGLSYTTDILPEINWNAEWEKNFSPVRVDDFCAIRAHFHPPFTDVSHELIITPKMSFGTGHHATTYMMIQAMRSIRFVNGTVLDFGAGTGVLAILAERLGARKVLALDNDDRAIENIKENLVENHCINISWRKAAQIPVDQVFDIILANVNKSVLMLELRRMGQQLAKGGVILTSGLLRDDIEEIENEAAICGLSISERMARDGWICLKMEKD